ncbi:MAG: hypothetical protein GEU83_20460 [Pseudonocardiaceae bacterium]|nr:hypothetical protein [Pseudonocardiaceae bacterium]
MPNTLPPLPSSDETWPPRRLHPQTIQSLRTILRDYDTSAYDLATAVQKITQTVKRDATRWARDRHRDNPHADQATTTQRTTPGKG